MVVGGYVWKIVCPFIGLELCLLLGLSVCWLGLMFSIGFVCLFLGGTRPTRTGWQLRRLLLLRSCCGGDGVELLLRLLNDLCCC